MEKSKRYYIFQMDTVWLTIISTLLFILVLVITCMIDRNAVVYSVEKIISMNIFIFIIIFLGYLFLHELLHSLAYVLYGGQYSKIIYGIALELGVLYCLCKQNITKNNILHSLMYPLFFIGIVTYILSMIFNLPLLLILSIFNICGSSGDIIMFIFISKLDKDIEFTETDDPISFAIYSDKDVSKINHFGLKYIGIKESVLRKDFTKIKVSKASYIIIIILLILCLLKSILV